MRPQRARLAWSIVAVVLLALAVAVLVAPVTAAARLGILMDVVGLPAFAIVGAVIVARRPGNAVGWVMLIGAACFSLEEAATSYVEASVAGRNLPATVFAAWLTTWIWSPAWLTLFGWLPLLFPDGRVLNRRWRWLAWIMIAGGVQVVAAMLLPELTYGRGEDLVYGPNPIGLQGQGDVLEGMVDGVAMLFVIVWLSTIVMQVLRYRRAGGVERLQLRWFLWSIVVVLGVILSTTIPSVATVVEYIPSGVVVMLIPVAVGIAVTRYRLYDLDRVLSRTVTFVIVIVLLLGLYIGSVLAVGSVLSQATSESDLTVAISTLLAAAAFRPLLHRVRSVVERRFNRRRYDAATAVAGFASRLRDEVNLDQIATDLVGVTHDTVAPSSVGIWLPSPNT